MAINEIPTSIYAEIMTHKRDSYWLSDNEDLLYAHFAKIAKKGNIDSQVIDSLLQVYPYIFTYGKLKQWTKILLDILKHYNKEQAHSGNGNGHSQSISEFFAYDLEPPEHAGRMIRTALRRARKRIDPVLMLELYINLFKSQIYQQNDSFNEDAVLAAFDLARQINDQEGYARLYQALSFAYNHWRNHDRALMYGQMAYDYWSGRKNKYETGLSAYAIGVAYRLLEQLDEAEPWLEITADFMSRANQPNQYALIAGETGLLKMQQKSYEEAISWLTLSLREYQKLEARNFYSEAIVFQSLGLANINNENLDQAEIHLGAALTYFKEHDQSNGYHIGQVNHSFALLEYYRKDKKQALAYLEKAYEASQNLPLDRKEGVVKRFDNLKQAIENDL